MAALITDCVKTGALSWRYEWSGTAPFNVYAYGQLYLANTDQTELIMTWDTDTADHRLEPPPIEVIDSTQTAAALKQVLHPPNFEIQFRGQTTASYYYVELSSDAGANWSALTVPEEGKGYYRISAYLPNTLDLQFRISAYDAQGGQGDYMEFDLFHHTPTIDPAVSYTYNAGTGLVTMDLA